MSTTSDTQSSTNDTIDELRTLILEAEQALANAGDAADDKIVEIRDRLRKALNKGRSTFGRLRQSAGEQAQKADETIRANPYESIGVALGLGLLIGYLLPKR
jgi:ElaB/YqjD/DUF883 family membrane-anchored ribosome-binding protein